MTSVACHDCRRLSSQTIVTQCDCDKAGVNGCFNFFVGEVALGANKDNNITTRRILFSQKTARHSRVAIADEFLDIL